MIRCFMVRFGCGLQHGNVRSARIGRFTCAQPHLFNVEKYASGVSPAVQGKRSFMEGRILNRKHRPVVYEDFDPILLGDDGQAVNPPLFVGHVIACQDRNRPFPDPVETPNGALAVPEKPVVVVRIPVAEHDADRVVVKGEQFEADCTVRGHLLLVNSKGAGPKRIGQCSAAAVDVAFLSNSLAGKAPYRRPLLVPLVDDPPRFGAHLQGSNVGGFCTVIDGRTCQRMPGAQHPRTNSRHDHQHRVNRSLLQCEPSHVECSAFGSSAGCGQKTQTMP